MVLGNNMSWPLHPVDKPQQSDNVARSGFIDRSVQAR